MLGLRGGKEAVDSHGHLEPKFVIFVRSPVAVCELRQGMGQVPVMVPEERWAVDGGQSAAVLAVTGGAGSVDFFAPLGASARQRSFGQDGLVALNGRRQGWQVVICDLRERGLASMCGCVFGVIPAYAIADVLYLLVEVVGGQVRETGGVGLLIALGNGSVAGGASLVRAGIQALPV